MPAWEVILTIASGALGVALGFVLYRLVTGEWHP
jgi:multisubunit Na+/H+ antiporter MnhF subunit